MTDTSTSGTVSVSRELLSAVHTDLENWLSHDLCECEGGHCCGRTDVEKHRDELRAILAQPAEQQDDPIGVVEPMPGTAGFTMAVFNAEEVPAGKKLYLRPDIQSESVACQLRFIQGETPEIVSWNEQEYGVHRLYRRPAAQAVKLPGRMPTGNITVPHHGLPPGVREGWNLCLDAVAKLNGIEP